MNTQAQWEFAGAVPDGMAFQIDGLDVWKHPWRDTKERVRVRDPHHDQEFIFSIYEIRLDERAVTFDSR